jgi:hypothetical protein
MEGGWPARGSPSIVTERMYKGGHNDFPETHGPDFLHLRPVAKPGQGTCKLVSVARESALLYKKTV